MTRIIDTSPPNKTQREVTRRENTLRKITPVPACPATDLYTRNLPEMTHTFLNRQTSQLLFNMKDSPRVSKHR
jgi:hypothetical protein